MAKFDAGTAVERLEFDFTAFGGRAGFIDEPSTGAVNRFFKNTKKMIKDVKALQKIAEDVEVEELSDEQIMDTIDKMDEAEEGATAMQEAMIMNIAELCGGHRELVEVVVGESEEPVDKKEVVVGGNPSYDDLNSLPYRVLQAFSQWLMAEIRPKRTTPGTNA